MFPEISCVPTVEFHTVYRANAVFQYLDDLPMHSVVLFMVWVRLIGNVYANPIPLYELSHQGEMRSGCS